MKYCPECGFETDNQEFNFCPACGDREGKGVVRLIARRVENTKGTSRKPYEESTAGLTTGMGSVVGGNIVYTDNRSIKELSEAERIAKNKAAFKEECEQRCKDGFVSQEDLLFLEKYRDDLGLERHFADEILKRAKEQSVRRVTSLPGTAKMLIAQTLKSIESNNLVSIKQDYEALEQNKLQFDVDELDQIYYQLKSILDPGKFEVKDEEYWSIFWSYVVYRKQNSPKADEVIASLHRWDTFYSPQNQTLLYTLGLLMQTRIDEAKVSFKEIAPGFSQDLQPIYDTIDNLIGRKWYAKTADVPARLKFYAESLFKKAYESLKAIAEINTAEELEKEAADRKKREAEKNKRDVFKDALKSNLGDVNAACFASGITPSQLAEWRESIPDFDESVQNVLDDIARKKEKEEQEAIRQAQVSQKLSAKKEQFKKLYESNGCDALKTCAELDLDTGTVQQWRREDPSFGEALEYIERLHADLVNQEKKSKCKVLFKKILPWLLIAILSVVCVLGVTNLINNHKDNKARIEAEQVAKEDYELSLTKFNLAFSHVDTSEEGLDALSNAAIALKQVIELEHSPYLEGQEESLALKRKFDERVEELLDNFQNKTDLVPEKGGNEIVWKDGKRGQKRVKEIINTLQQ